MIIVTGAAGFIASVLCKKLNEKGHENLILVDDFSKENKRPNWEDLKFIDKIDRTNFIEWFEQNKGEISFVYHLGARTDTTEFDTKIFDELNLNYSKSIWNICLSKDIPLIYASSAATYGDGDFGYDDDETKIPNLKPLNPYGQSKQDFDVWVLNQDKKLSNWAGLKFFNVFGPNEYHKGRMASVVFHAFNQIKNTGEMKLFRSHNPEFGNGEQKRDFVYIKDVVSVLYFFLSAQNYSGVYNLGSGQANTFNALAKGVFNALNLDPKIEYIDTPIDIRDKYQYYTKAEMQKLKGIGYSDDFTNFQDAIEDYVINYLESTAKK